MIVLIPTDLLRQLFDPTEKISNKNVFSKYSQKIISLKLLIVIFIVESLQVQESKSLYKLILITVQLKYQKVFKIWYKLGGKGA